MKLPIVFALVSIMRHDTNFSSYYRPCCQNIAWSFFFLTKFIPNRMNRCLGCLHSLVIAMNQLCSSDFATFLCLIVVGAMGLCELMLLSHCYGALMMYWFIGIQIFFENKQPPVCLDYPFTSSWQMNTMKEAGWHTHELFYGLT